MKIANINVQINNSPSGSKRFHSNNSSEDMVIARKEDSGYIKAMDLDGDGKITNGEFNQYCEDNAIIGDAKQNLLLILSVSKATTQIKNKSDEHRKAEEEEQRKKEETEKERRKKEQEAEEKNQEHKSETKTEKREKVLYKEYVKKSKKQEEVKAAKAAKAPTEYKNDKVKKAIETYDKTNTKKEVTTSKEDATYEKEA